MSFGAIRSIMIEMYDLLRKHDAGQQDIPEAVIAAIDRGDDEEAKRLLKRGGFWGGAGSAATGLKKNGIRSTRFTA